MSDLQPLPLICGTVALGQPICAEAAFADSLNGCVAALGVQLTHDAVDVIFDGVLGEIQVRGNFFIGHAPGEE